MRALYSAAYFKGNEYSDYIGDKAVLQRNFRMRLKEIRRHSGTLTDKNLLEVGCAYGYFLEIAQSICKEAVGIDIAEDAIRLARSELRVDARCCDFCSVDLLSRPDIICFWDTIEHIRDPASFVARAAELLPMGGYLFLTTGDVGSLNARLRREHWRLIHPPTHLHYFSAKSISELLSRSGFAVKEISHPGFYRSIGNTVANLMRGGRKGLFVNKLSALDGSYYLNLFDIMFVAAKKIR